MDYDLDIIVPVYNEQDNILKTLSEINKLISINYRIIIIYDYDDDPTIKVVNDNFIKKEIIIVKNKYAGFNGAVKTAFEMLNAKAIILYPADDHKNFNLINEMFKKFNEGYDIVCASRFIEGGSYKGAPFLKRLIVKLVSFTLSNLTTLPTRDATNGFRLFSKEIIEKFTIESKRGFTFSIELLAKAHRSNYKITELPEQWPVRNYGKSKFKYSSIFFYIQWYIYILLTRFKNEKKN